MARTGRSDVILLVARFQGPSDPRMISGTPLSRGKLCELLVCLSHRLRLQISRLLTSAVETS